eukprot:Em0004g1484a
MDQHGLMVAHSIIDAAATHTMVQVLNPGFAPVTVYKDEIMGMLKPIQDPADCASVQYPVCKQSTWSVQHSIQQMTDSLAPDVREKVADLLWQFQDVIALDDSDLGRTRLTSHQINTGDTQPVRQQATRLPFHQQQEVRGLLDDMLSQGIIEPSCGPWASPIVLAKKKDGTTRFCVDFRRLNDCTRKDAQPLPRIDDTLDALGGAQYFSTLDLASGYWQVEVDSRDREKTAFVTPFGLFQFRVMPFGLCNAPATFQRLMERVLAGLHWMTCLVYLDDIIIFSRSVETHVKQLKEVLERLKIAGLKIRPKKCHLLQTSVQYLGHVISAEGIRTDPQKVAYVCFQLASTENFERAPKFSWTRFVLQTFCERLCSYSKPFACFDRESLPFVLDTDASGDGLGAVLAQNVDGVERVVAYASRALSRTEKKYCATRREMLALVWAARHFRPYLYGRKFTLRTDHHCLQWLHNFKEPEGQVARWLEVLSEYDYTVIHRVGKQHTNADALSRGRCVQCGLEKKEEEREEANSCDAVSHLMLPTWTEEEIKSFQSADPDIHQMVYWLETDATPTGCPRMLHGGLHPWGGTGRHLQLVLPAKLVNGVLEGLHNTLVGGHMGERKTKSPSHKARAPMEISQTLRPMQRVAMDILGPLPETLRGNKYILVVGEYFTKWKEAFPLKDTEALTIAKVFVNEFVCRFGVPDSLHTDQGRNFEAKVLKEVCQLLGVKKTRTTPYHPQSDGLVERFNRTLLDMLSMAVKDDERDWDLLLPTLLFAYRTSRHVTTGVTPFELMYGCDARLPEDVLFSIPATAEDPIQYADVLKNRLQLAYKRVNQHMAVQQGHQKESYDADVRGDPYCINDLVFLHNPAVRRGFSKKLHRPWQGPFKVVKVLGPSIYRIVDCTNPRRRKVVHFNRLKPAPSHSTAEEEDEYYDVIVHSVPPADTDRQATILEVPRQHQLEHPVPKIEQPAVVPRVPPPAVEGAPALRRSNRISRPPVRYGDPMVLPDTLDTPEIFE